MLAALLAAGADPDRRTARDLCTALHLAAQRNHVGAVRQLLAAGTSVDAHMYASFTPLIMAATTGGLEAAEALLAAGAGEGGRRGAAGCGAARPACGGGRRRAAS